jgi:5-oxoprolinase (ATP-hydrolysing)
MALFEIAAGKNTVHVEAGERLQILTPGGGGWGTLQT